MQTVMKKGSNGRQSILNPGLSNSNSKLSLHQNSRLSTINKILTEWNKNYIPPTVDSYRTAYYKNCCKINALVVKLAYEETETLTDQEWRGFVISLKVHIEQAKKALRRNPRLSLRRLLPNDSN